MADEDASNAFGESGHSGATVLQTVASGQGMDGAGAAGDVTMPFQLDLAGLSLYAPRLRTDPPPNPKPTPEPTPTPEPKPPDNLPRTGFASGTTFQLQGDGSNYITWKK